jgi:outer membrane protein TolC
MMHMMKRQMICAGWLFRGLVTFFAVVLPGAAIFAQTNATSIVSTNVPGWITQPLSMVNALDLTLRQNSGLQKARADLEASRGLVIQTRAVALPSVQATGNYTDTARNDIQNFPSFGPSGTNATTNTFVQAHQNWDTQIRITQSIYQGGRVMSAFRAARLQKEQSLLQYQTAVADALLATRIAYYDVLVAQQQILVNEASVNLLNEELQDQQRRYEAGTVPRFNVLQAEVAVANARPPLINARNTYRIAKNNLSNLLGFNLPREVWEDIPLNLTDKLDAQPYNVELPASIAQALERRTELAALQKTQGLQHENVINARAGYKPVINAFAAYDWHNNQFSEDVGDELNGWMVGGELTWNIFDGLATYGKVVQAKAQFAHAKADVEDRSRQIELEVRTDYSGLIEAREVLESQQKVQEQAEEALRLAKARADAGTGTRLDVLNAETQLTQARTTQVQGLHDYDVARARLERAIGQEMISGQETKSAAPPSL